MTTTENKNIIDTIPTQMASEQLVQPSMKQSSYLKWGIIGGVVFLVLLESLYFFKKSSTPASVSIQVPQVTQQAVFPSVQPTKLRSKTPGIIVNVATAKGVDLKTGEAVSPTTVFLATDKSIYVVMTLRNVKVGTRIAYTRYLNNKFIDNRSMAITKSNTNNTNFIWTLKKLGATHPVGNYLVKTYTNGVFEKETTYIVQ